MPGGASKEGAEPLHCCAYHPKHGRVCGADEATYSLQKPFGRANARYQQNGAARYEKSEKIVILEALVIHLNLDILIHGELTRN